MTKSTQPKFELLKEAYAIIGGIPKKAIDLDSIQEERGESLSCGTICCGIGWLGHHPKFQALGLRTVGNSVQYKGVTVYYEEAVADIFNLDRDDAEALFASTYFESKWDIGASPKLSHKQRWMYRMRAFLRKHGQLKYQLEKKPA